MLWSEDSLTASSFFRMQTKRQLKEGTQKKDTVIIMKLTPSPSLRVRATFNSKLRFGLNWNEICQHLLKSILIHTNDTDKSNKEI